MTVGKYLQTRPGGAEHHARARQRAGGLQYGQEVLRAADDQPLQRDQPAAVRQAPGHVRQARGGLRR